MYKQFETDRFDLVKTDKVRIENYLLSGHSERGELNVWIDVSDKGKRFLYQSTFQGNKNYLHTGVYTKKCHILSEKLTGHYYFLDINDCGIWLFNDTFSGSENYDLDQSIKIQQWLDSSPQ